MMLLLSGLRKLSVSDITLRYLDPSLPVTIQVDASQVGLGTALLQNGKPVAFASKALTKTECRYMNIEREMPAAVFGAERFHTYIYGWSFMIESDYKLLESISRKNLADTPARLQCMMLCLQGYDFTIRYCPGKEMVIPDTLSPFSPRPGPDLPLDITIHHAHIMPDHKEAFQQAFCERPRNASSCQPHHHRLARGHKGGPSSPLPILATPRNPHHQGWSSSARWSPRHSSCQKERETLHQLHQGITKSQLLTRGSFFWPGINKAIKEVVHQCETCTWFQSQNAAAPLTPTPTPSHPW